MEVSLRVGQFIPIELQPVTGGTNPQPAQLDGVPVWTVQVPALGILEVAPDGRTAIFRARVPGVTDITVTGDADMSSGTRLISSVPPLTVTVTPGEAQNIQFLVGTPETDPTF